MIEDVLRTKILTDGTVTGLIAGRYYPGVIPQNPTYPLIVATKISDVEEGVLEGLAGFARARIQVNSWAKSYVDARSITNAVVALIDGTTGTWSGVIIGSSRIENDADAYSEEVNDFGRRLDIMLLYHR